MRRSLSRDGITALTGTFGLQVMGLVSAVLAARLFGVSDRGLLAQAVAWSVAVNALADLGLSQAVPYYAAKTGRSVAFSAAGIVWVTGFILGILGAIVSRLLSPDLPWSATAYIAFTTPFALMLGVLATNHQGLGNLKEFQVLRWAGQAPFTLALLAALSPYGPSIDGVLWISLALTLAFSVSAVALAFRSGCMEPPTDRQLSAKLLAFGRQTYFGSLAWMGNARIPILGLGIAASAEATGLLAVAAGYALVPYMVAASLALTAPSRIASQDPHRARSASMRLIAVGLALTIPVAMLMMATSQWFLPAVFGEIYMDAVPVAVVLTFCAIVLGANTLLTATLRAAGRPLDPSRAEAFGLLITVVAILPASQFWGAMGAAWVIAGAGLTTLLFLGIAAVNWLRQKGIAQTESVRVSLLTPAYNAADYLPDLLESVQQQTHRNLEHVVIDDGSKDGTLSVLQRYPATRVVSRANKGQYATQNELIEMATGDILCVICADDYLARPDAVECAAAAFAADSNLDVLIGRTPRHVEGHPTYIANPDPHPWLAVRLVRLCLAFQHCSVFVRRSLLIDHRIHFDATYRMRGDWDWLLQVLRSARKVRTTGMEMGCWRQHRNQTSKVASDHGRLETHRLLREQGVSPKIHVFVKRILDLYGKFKHFSALMLQQGPMGVLEYRSGKRLQCHRGRVLVIVDYYLPGFKGGGPAVSVSRIVARLGEEEEFYVFTRDRDLGDSHPYCDVPIGEWTSRGKALVYYAPPSEWNPKGLLKAIRHVGPDIIYPNSFFSVFTVSVLLLRFLRLLPGIRIVLGPRGEFSPGALRIKSRKKSLFLTLSRLLGLYRGILWHLSSELERAAVESSLGGPVQAIVSLPYLPARDDEKLSERTPKRRGEARFVFLSRISSKKNLDGAIRLLSTVTGQTTLTVYGPIEEEAYFQECVDLAKALAPTLSFVYGGALEPARVQQALAVEHYFLFPTQGENFGHVIAEALAAGCPVLLSDQTPWTDLEETNAGWTLPLADIAAWTRRLQALVDEDQSAYNSRLEAVQNYFQDVLNKERASEKGINLFAVARSLVA